MKASLLCAIVGIGLGFTLPAYALFHKKTRHGGEPPYVCSELHLKAAKQSIKTQKRAYQFQGICKVKVTEKTYRGVWLNIDAEWDGKTKTATEFAKITAGGQGKIQMILKCQDDPWITNAKCLVGSISNTTGYPNLSATFTRKNKGYPVGYPPVARGIMTGPQIKSMFESPEVGTKPPPPPKKKPQLKSVKPLEIKPSNTKVFMEPSYKGYRIHWCRHVKGPCGKPAADLFCLHQGYKTATQWEMAPNVGTSLIFGDGRLCHSAHCAGFSMIRCEK